MAIIHQEALEERARNLDAKGLNGMEFVLVTLQPAVNPTTARLEVHFFNDRELANIVTDFTTNGVPATQIFPISGGHRVLAGSATGHVQVSAIAHPSPTSNILNLTVTPIGDYSTYTLSLNHQNIDPLFNELRFKFRPGCFSTECAPKQTFKPAPQDPAIDYLAKDYESFRHTMIAAMMQRVPGWQPTSEADLDQVLLELFSVAADELSDYQDRVMNEAYLATARKRVSWARHARLMDYHIHQGNQASTWVAVRVADSEIFVIPKGFLVWTGEDVNHTSAAVFMTQQETPPLFEDISTGSILLVTLQLSSDQSGLGTTYFFKRRITKVSAASANHGALTGGTTVVQLNQSVALANRIYTDIRSVEFHEVIGEQLTLTSVRKPDLTADRSRLYFYGDGKTYQKLQGRSLQLVQGDRIQQLTTGIDHTSVGVQERVTLRPISLNPQLQHFTLDDFPLDKPPTVTVYGNLVEANQGKTEQEAVLGNGDSRQVFQTFN